MKTSWRELPWMQIALVAIILAAAGAMIVRLKGRAKPVDRMFAGNLQEAVGYVAAEEAARVLGARGGRVALILPGKNERQFRGSAGEAFERGFRRGAEKNPGAPLAGHLLAWQPLPQNGNLIAEDLTLGTLQGARAKFPEATVLVSFIGLPQFAGGEETQWLKASPPKLIVVQNVQPPAGVLEKLFAQEIVQCVLNRTANLPEAEPQGEPREIFLRFYKVLTPAVTQ